MRGFKERFEIFNLIKSNTKLKLNQIIIMKLLLMIVTLIPPMLYKILIDDVIVKQKLSYLKIVVILYIALFLIESLILYYKTYKENLVYNKLSYDIKTTLFKFCIYEKNDFTERFENADIKNRLDNDVESMVNFVQIQIVECIIEVVQLLISAALLISINYKLAFISFLVVPTSFIISKKIKNNISKETKEYQKKFYSYENWLQKTLLGWKEVKALNIEDDVCNDFTKRWNGLKSHYVKKTVNTDLGYILSSFNNFFVKKLSIYCIGGVFVYYSLTTIGQVLMFIKYFQLLFNSIETINGYDIKFSSEKILIYRVLEFLKLAKNSKEQTISKNTFENMNIKIENLYFKYPNSSNFVLKNLKLLIKEGEKIAILGESGCGKSTLAKLILGLYDDYEGNIYIGGKDIREVKDTELYSNISAIMQDTMLFNISIKENLRIASSEATESQIVEACKIADIHDFIVTLPQGYDTVIGKNGTKLSGGQRQKIAIARALIKDAPILIFDESTSALDREAERTIINELNKISKNKTVIIISHRESTIEYCKRIVKLNELNEL
ncbi:ATP-binding cassette, subfamily B, MsbA [Clostridium collagenovorans DSM 3089]|uniref:ATP-binding cassette, subfamily B, MsbA n=1 Tax=Clostridium collagenovorans DSM 3089 TaxID=1121306 RepID=A0A1M5V9F6_9CLOT|nr:ABC transporter ATP-binding protein [Clostridium collagenovorans]SHH71841.1 ATP-binding cassette, subfamily B, MsbA [Clostridium collagenovorans DSM 3089]